MDIRFDVLTNTLARWMTRRAGVRRAGAGRRLALLVLPLALALGPGAAAGQTFANDDGIAIPGEGADGPAAPYPSTIAVSGVAGVVADLDVRLTGLDHDWPSDIDVLLVGPGGQTALVMSDVGAGMSVSGVTLTLDDEAADRLPDAARLTTGTFRPTNAKGFEGDDDNFPAPAPAHDGRSALSAFDGTNPNGTWRLFVRDDVRDDTGSLAGWSLEIAHGGGAPNAGDDAYRVPEDRALKRGAAAGVLANDADPDGEPLSARLVEGPAKGTLTLADDGSFVYKPKRNFHGTVSFTYAVEDAQGFVAEATATIKVLARPG